MKFLLLGLGNAAEIGLLSLIDSITESNQRILNIAMPLKMNKNAPTHVKPFNARTIAYVQMQ